MDSLPWSVMAPLRKVAMPVGRPDDGDGRGDYPDDQDTLATLARAAAAIGTPWAEPQEGAGAWSQVVIDEQGMSYMVTIQPVSISPEGEIIV